MFNIAFAQDAAIEEAQRVAGEVGGAASDAAQNGATQAAPGNPFSSMLPMIIMFVVIMYFFIFRPQQKREKERREMLSALAKGDRVVTSGGIYGTIVGLTEKSAVLRVSDDENIKMEFARGAVSHKVSDTEE